MKHVCLIYSYCPGPDHMAETDDLQRTLRRVIEATNKRVLDGLDLYGRPLEVKIENRIARSGGLITLANRKVYVVCNYTDPEAVSTELRLT